MQNLTTKQKKAEAYYKIANELLKNKNFLKAIENYKNAVMFNPSHFKAYCNLGVAYRNLGQPKLAEGCYLKAKKLNPKSNIALNNLANIYVDLSQYKEAIILYQKAIIINPQDIDAIQNLSNIYKALGNHEKVVEMQLKLNKLKL